MFAGSIRCENIESMTKIIIMLIRENILFEANEEFLTIHVKGY